MALPPESTVPRVIALRTPAGGDVSDVTSGAVAGSAMRSTSGRAAAAIMRCTLASFVPTASRPQASSPTATELTASSSLPTGTWRRDAGLIGVTFATSSLWVCSSSQSTIP